MAPSVLVKTMLTTEMISLGRQLLTYLDSEQVVFDAAFWLLDDDIGEWRLYLSSTRVYSEGPKIFYRRVNQAIYDLDLTKALSIEMVSIVDERTPIVQLLVDALGQAASVDGARLDPSSIWSFIALPPS